MKFLLDQDVYAATARFLNDLGHDVVPVVGNLVFVQALGAGVLYLRILPSTQNAVHNELERVLRTHAEEDLARAFVVIEPDGHRIRRLPGQ